MTAAHLERVAREMAELAAFHEVTPMCPSVHSQVVERNVRYFKPILAAALAACARESEKPYRRVVEAAKAVDSFYVYLDSTIAQSANGARVAIQILRDELRTLQARNE